MPIKTTKKYYHTPLGWLLSKKGGRKDEKKTSFGKEVGKLEFLRPVDRNVKWCSLHENSMVTPQKIKSIV